MDKKISVDLDEFSGTGWLNKKLYGMITSSGEDYWDVKEPEKSRRYFISVVQNELARSLKLDKYMPSFDIKKGGFRGYSEVVHYGNFYMAFEPSNWKKGVYFQFHASGLNEYRSNLLCQSENKEVKSWTNFDMYKFVYLHLVATNQKVVDERVDENTLLGHLEFYFDVFRLSRVDFAVDLFNYDIDLDSLARGLSNGTVKIENQKGWKNKSRFKTILENGKVQTLYIGERSSPFYLRIYDKKAEQLSRANAIHRDLAENNEQWIRCELEIKQEPANSLTKQLYEMKNEDFPDFGICMIFNRYRFKNAETGELLPISQAMADALTAEHPEYYITKPGKNTELDKAYERFLRGSSGLQTFLYCWAYQNGYYDETLVDKFLMEVKEEQKYFCHYPSRRARAYSDMARKTKGYGRSNSSQEN